MKRILLLAPIMILLVGFNLYGGDDETRKDKPGFNSSHNQVGFTENKGQFRDQAGNPNPDVLYMADFGGMKVQLRKTGFSYETYQVKPKWVDPASIPYKILTFTENSDTLESWPGQAEAQKNLMYHFHRVDVELVGAKLNPEILADGKTGETRRYVNAVKGGESVEVAGFSQVRYNDVYPGIDLLCYANSAEGGFKYDFILKPGVNLSAIELEYKGAKSLELEQDGNLSLKTRFGILSESIPACYTEDATGNRKEVTGIGFQLEGNKLKFKGKAIQFYEKLVIDPAVNRVWGTYFGGTGGASGESIKVDENHFIYVCGNTSGIDNIATVNSYQDSLLLAEDGFFEKFSPDGTSLIYGTYLSGLRAKDMDLRSGTLAITGPDGIIVFDTSGQFLWNHFDQSVGSGICYDPGKNLICVGDSILKLNESGNLIWKIDFGGTQTEINDVACDLQGNIFITGSTEDTTGISTPESYQPIFGGKRDILLGPGPVEFSYDYWGISGDAFLAKLSSYGSVIWSSYIGGKNLDFGHSIFVSDSVVVISGMTNSLNVISTTGSYQEILKPNSGYGFQIFSIGGHNCPDPNQWYFCGSCQSSIYFPQPYDSCCQCADQFVMTFTTDGQKRWGTYIGDNYTEKDGEIQIDKRSDVLVGGTTYCFNDCLSSIATPYSFQSTTNYGISGYIVSLDQNGSRRYGTYLPNGWDWNYMTFGGLRLNSVVHTGLQRIFATGTSNYEAGIATPGAYQAQNGFWNSGWGSGFIISMASSELDSIINPQHKSICLSDTLKLVSGVYPDTLSTIIYQWQKNTVNIPGAVGRHFMIPAIPIADTGWYRCVIKDEEYVWTTDSAQVTIREHPAFNMEQIFSVNRQVTCGDINHDGVVENLGDSILYLNGMLNPPVPVYFPGINHCYPRMNWFDFNNEGNLDCAIDNGIFINDNGLFNKKTISSWNVWADLNNDGTTDGFNWSGGEQLILANRNNSIIPLHAGYSSGWYGSGADQHTLSADVDNDGDNDFIRIQTSTIGQCNGSNFFGSGDKCLVLFNNHNGYFTDTPIPIPFHDEMNGRIAMGDFDADGDLDLLVTTIVSLYPSDTLKIRVLKNQNGLFSIFYVSNMSCNYPATYPNHATWGDLDNDGFLDFIAGKFFFRFDGITFQHLPTAYGMTNSGLGQFEASLADFDNDHDLDIITSSGFYKNEICNAPNTLPSSPDGIETVVSADSVFFSWHRASDVETPRSGLTYNLRIGTTPGGNQIMSSLSDSTGRRKLASIGNASQDTTWWLHNLNSGDYYWSVQAIDNSYEGGTFAPESHFQIWLPPEITVQPYGYTGCPGDSVSLKAVGVCYFPLTFQWYKNNEPLILETDSILMISPLDSSNVGSYYCKISNTQFNTCTDTVEIKLLFDWFVLDTIFNMNMICLDYNEDDSLDVIPDSHGFLNYCDKNSDGLTDLMYSQDSVRFYQNINQSWSTFSHPLPPAQKVKRQDLDNDGDTDFLLSRYESTLELCYLRLAWTNGETFGYTDLPYEMVESGTIDLIDIDNDKDFDIFFTGWNHVYGWDGPKITKLFLNTKGVFTEAPVSIPGLVYASTDWGDYDNDGDLDLLINGSPDFLYTSHFTKVYINQNGILVDAGFDLLPTYNTMVQWIDYDIDGLLDIKVGQTIYHQENNNFTLSNGIGQPGYLCDYDNDGDLDILCENKLFKNQFCNTAPNTIPGDPLNLETIMNSDTVHFIWNPATDAQTPSPGLSYNLRVGTTPGDCQVMSPMSNPSGFRQVVELGNCQQNLGWWLHNLKPGTYYWSVQAIDNSYAGGPFAPEQTFEILAATHCISVPEGWSGLSSWVLPNNDAVESVFLPIQNQLTILQTMEEMYFPSQNINTIGNWESQSAFKIKVTNDCMLNIAGSVDQNKNFALDAGWNLMPVICNLPVDPVPLFSPVSSDLKIVKDVAGSGVYWPEYGINSLGSLLPGKAYFVKMNNAGTITFPQNDFSELKTSDFQKEPEQPSPWGWIYKTPSSHLFALPANITHQFSDNSFIGAFTTEGVCAGSCSVKNGQSTVLVANPDDPLTPEKEGFIDGEPLSFRIWDAVTEIDYLLQVKYDMNQPDHSGVFSANGISAISGIQILTDIREEFLKGIMIFPNPTNGKLNISGIASGTEIKVTIISSTGKSLQVIALKNDGAIDVSHLSAGVYFVKLEDGNSVRFEKVVVE